MAFDWMIKKTVPVDGAENTARVFSSIVRQITPSYQRRILKFLAKNKDRSFTNIEISNALNEDRSNIWRFLNRMINEAGAHSLVTRTEGDGGRRRVLYSWREPELQIGSHSVSEILVVLDHHQPSLQEHEQG